MPDWLTVEQQRRLVAAWRGWAAGGETLGMRHTVLPSGGRMSVQTVCLGWHWEPYRYVREVDGVPVAGLPTWLAQLARDGVAAAYEDDRAAAAYEPDCALINYYDETARMGLHRDREERIDAPVVSLSIGAACTFRFGNTVNRRAPYTDVELRSGDLFVFGAPSRFAYHGVVRPVHPRTDDPALGLDGGRINYTIRATGL
ncbi:MAG TPA: alpha-ketoglutarate-dependent dioxygenase AlkB [Solirubrobacteraceae bacterium]|nr:alpha-ketoglutarate-dependent dioxygenase AlkB [Solirubrobacteraceae bacterium]